jgi:predicted regulator of amino acid metabolism with ACT domain
MYQQYNTPIANMATIAPKRGFSVVTVAKAAQLCVFFAKASRFINVLEIFTASTRKENPILKEIFEEILPSYI